MDRRLGQMRRAQALHHAVMDRLGGVKTFRPAAQDHRIAGFQAQRPGIRRHVGTAFIDHTDHAQRRCHPLNMQTIRAVPFGQNPPHRIALFSHGAQAINDAAQAGFVQHQAVHHGGA